MPISGKFVADFASFNAAVQTAETNLRSFEQGGAKVESQLTKVTNSLSGTKLIQDATIMAEAVERLGGVSALTEKELKKLGATATEAVEKANKLGVDVPPGIQKIADASKGAETSAFGWKNALLSVGGALGVAFSFNLIKDFAVSVVQTGAAIGDLSQKLGVSTEAVQRWKFAAEQSGATIENVDKALSTMNRTLSEGSKGTKAILDDIGLSFADIRAMKPEDAFNTITEAISKIEDPMLRAEAATKLFGKSGQELLPAIADGFVEVGKSAAIMSEDTIRRLKDAEDAWGRLRNNVVIYSGEIIGASFRVATGFTEMITALMPGQGDAQLGAAFRTITGETDALAGAIRRIPPVAKAMSDGLKPITLSGAEVENVIKNMNTAIGNTAPQIAMLEPKVGSLDKAIKGFTEHNEVMNTRLRFTSEVIGELPPKLEAMADSLNKVAVAQTAVAASKDAPGSVGINTGGIQVGNLDAAFKQYSQQYFQGPLGAIGGGPAEDFLSWALRNGYASRAADTSGSGTFAGASSSFAGAPQGANVNVNGILMGTDPAALQQLRDLISASVQQGLGGSRAA